MPNSKSTPELRGEVDRNRQVEHWQRNAAKCRDLASGADSYSDRTRWLSMAQFWEQGVRPADERVAQECRPGLEQQGSRDLAETQIVDIE
jgi:hypothetical protein